MTCEMPSSCDHEVTLQEEINQKGRLMGSDAECWSSYLPLYRLGYGSVSVASTEEGKEENSRRRWANVPQCFSNSIAWICAKKSPSKSEWSFQSTTTQAETEGCSFGEQRDASQGCLSSLMDKFGESRWSRSEQGDLAVDGTATAHESVECIEPGDESKRLQDDMVSNENWNEGLEEENEVLRITLCHDRKEKVKGQENVNNVGTSAQHEDADRSSQLTSGKDETVIVLPAQANRRTVQAIQKTSQHTRTQQLLSTN